MIYETKEHTISVHIPMKVDKFGIEVSPPFNNLPIPATVSLWLRKEQILVRSIDAK